MASGAVMLNASAGNMPFDPQAPAALYTRMFQLTGGAGMMGGMGGGNFGGGFGGGMSSMGRGMSGMGMSVVGPQWFR